ncbi:hypothetical protein SADUNF_Sadunf07G0063100 [Salix dunnii]|uniref:Uncharacterized protein n=1 Tax=Salix dunnii TaxID=1413687 RepID=A0A835JVX6_9ROSI|nr:hypothetical protein SADUNF_Sadunf07G0063100 [Salix dunnii]
MNRDVAIERRNNVNNVERERRLLAENKGRPMQCIMEQVRDGSTISVYFLPDFKFVQVFEISSLLLLRIPTLSFIGLSLV